MPNQFKIFNPSSVPELDVAKMRARRQALGLTAWECSMSLFNEAGMWEQFEAGNVASLESGAVFFFADLLLCRYDDLLTWVSNRRTPGDAQSDRQLASFHS